MQINTTLSSTLLGTSAMTLYSYIISEHGTKNFKEPQLLNAMMKRYTRDEEIPEASGWILHYAVGFGFSTAYNLLWQKAIRPNYTSGILMGALNGAIGIGVWSTAFETHPAPPTIDRNAFYRHLVVAHMVFGAFSILGYKMVNGM